MDFALQSLQSKSNKRHPLWLLILAALLDVFQWDDRGAVPPRWGDVRWIRSVGHQSAHRDHLLLCGDHHPATDHTGLQVHTLTRILMNNEYWLWNRHRILLYVVLKTSSILLVEHSWGFLIAHFHPLSVSWHWAPLQDKNRCSACHSGEGSVFVGV